MRTPEEIKGQIEKLEQERTSLPEYSMFGDPNHQIIDAQISILDGSCDLSDIDEGDFEEMDEQNKIYRGAEDAQSWLDGDMDEL